MGAARWIGQIAMLAAALGLGTGTTFGENVAWADSTLPRDVHTGNPLSGRFEDFDGPIGSAPDPAKWSVVEGTGWDIGVENYRSGNAVLDGHGSLKLQAVNSGGGYVSGRIQTKNKASFGYGTLTARIKMPSGQGLWPAFWLVGADEDINPWPGAGEINVVELINTAQERYSSIHGPIPGVSDYLQAQIGGRSPDLSYDFHSYWVTRSENSIIVGVDNTEWGMFTPASLPSSARWVFNKPFYAILNLAVGGAWAGPPGGSTRFPATMLVDWVHWQSA